VIRQKGKKATQLHKATFGGLELQKKQGSQRKKGKKRPSIVSIWVSGEKELPSKAVSRARRGRPVHLKDGEEGVGDKQIERGG